MTKDITKLSLVNLKALAYDTLSVIEMQQGNLKVINEQIRKLGEQDAQTKEAEVVAKIEEVKTKKDETK